MLGYKLTFSCVVFYSLLYKIEGELIEYFYRQQRVSVFKPRYGEEKNDEEDDKQEENNDDNDEQDEDVPYFYVYIEEDYTPFDVI